MRVTTKARFIALLIGITFSFNSFAQSGLDAPNPLGSYLDGSFPDTIPGSAFGTMDWVQQDYYPGLSFVEPIRIVEHPIANKLIVVGKDGKGWSVTHEQGSTDKALFFDISSIMHGKSGVGEGGISDLVFHPEYGNNASANSSYVYISYRWNPDRAGTYSGTSVVDGYNRVSRFSVINNQVDLSTEYPLITQYDREQWHIGMAMFFGDDGYLYISLGDEGNCCDRTESTQRIDGGLWSGILRIDVDKDPARSHPIRRQPRHPGADPRANGANWPLSFTQGYFIPNDNPFVNSDGSALEEFYSIGLRHPWSMSKDVATGNIWVADVGEASREEISIVSKGDNHQWSYKEGTVSGVLPKPDQIIGNEVPPVWDYDRQSGQAVIGAGVYRGDLYPELYGKYLFSDFSTGKLWTAEFVNGDYSISQIGTITSGFPNGINSYLLDSKGNVLLAKTSGSLNSNGKIQLLTRSAGVVPTPEPPQLLSQTGAFTDLASLDVHPGCVPYDLNVPFWSDAALKFRWMCVPNTDGIHNLAQEKIDFSTNGNWTFPVGSVLIKHFELQTDYTDPSSVKRLETRFIVHSDEGYYGVTYRWDESGNDAHLLVSSEQLTLPVNTPQGQIQQSWYFPGRNDCLTCHSNVAGGVLGPNSRQLNRLGYYPLTGRHANQIETLNSLGMLSPAISNVGNLIDSVLTSTPTNDSTASLTHRARSYLDSNCSYCHRPNGVRANFDARLTTPLESQGLLYGRLTESLGIDDAAVIVPGSVTKSLLFHRMNSAGESFSMPPLAKDRVDSQGVAVIEDWILSMGGFKLGNDTSSGGSFIDSHHPSLVINEQDVYVHDDQQLPLTIRTFSFYAQRLGNPVTPVVVRVDEDNNFTVLAIGTTRTESEYFVGENSFNFDDTRDVELTLDAGDKIAVGFMDSYPDGSGWGAGSVIPAEGSGGSTQDEIWVLLPDPLISQSTSYLADRDTAVVQLGQAIMATNSGQAVQEISSLKRSYKFSMTISRSGSVVSPPSGDPTPDGQVPTVVNGSFEEPSVSNWKEFSNGGDVPGWANTKGSMEIDNKPWPASQGVQSTDLSDNEIEQTISGVQSGAVYALEFDYALHASSPSSRSAEIKIDGQSQLTVTANTSMKPPNYQVGRVEFTGKANGQVTIGFKGLSTDSLGVVLDNVRLLEISGGVDPMPDPDPDVSTEIGAVTDANAGANVVSESASAGTLVGVTAIAQDLDAGDSVSYSITSDPSNAFAIGANSGVVSVGSVGVLNYEAAQSVQIEVTAISTDTSSSSESFTITVLEDGSGGGDGQVPTVVNGSFEEPSVSNWKEFSNGGDVPGWANTKGSMEIDNKPWPASQGVQSTDLSDNEIEQTISGVQSGAVYALEFDYALHASSPSSRSAEIKIDGQSQLTVTANTSMKPPNYQVGRVEFTGKANGQVTIGFKGLSTDSLGVVLDNVRLLEISGGVDPMPDPDPDVSTEIGAVTDANAGANVVSESASAGTLVGVTAIAQDLDAGDSVSYSITSDPSNAFAIGANSGVVSVGSAGVLNYEAAQSVQIEVTAISTDTSSSSESFTITVLEDGSGGGDGQVPTVVNGSFEEPSVSNWKEFSNGGDVPGWANTKGSMEIDNKPWPASQGVQSTDLSDNEIEQTISGVQSGAVYALEFDYALHASSPSSRSAEIKIDGQSQLTVTANTSMKPPNYQVGRVEFTGKANGQVTIGFKGLSTDSLGVVLDNVRLLEISGGVDPMPDPDPDVSTEIGAVTDANAGANVVSESASAGTLVGVTAIAQDLDAGDSVSYSITSDPSNAFAIGANSGVVSVGSAGVLNYEAAQSVQIEVTAISTDTSSSSESFTITVLEDGSGGGDGQVPTVVNGSFEEPSVSNWKEFSNGGDVPGWANTKGSMEIDNKPWPASQGVQSTDLSDNEIEQTISGVQSGAVYALEFDYALHASSPSSRSAEIKIDGQSQLTVTANTSMKPPNYQVGRVEFTGKANGQVTIGFKGLSTDSLGVVLDNVRLLEISGGVDPMPDPDPDVSTEIGAVTDANAGANVVSESASAGTLVGVTAIAQDLDAGDSVSYSITSDPSNAFAIAANSGVVSVGSVGVLNYEAAQSVQIEVTAISTDTSSSSESFTIAVLEDGSGEEFGINNGDFEDGLTGWDSEDVALESNAAYQGEHSVDLQNGYLEQVISGLTPGIQYYLEIAYKNQSGTSAPLVDAHVLIDGSVIGEIHNKQTNEYVDCNGYEFIADSQAQTLRIQSLEPGSAGALIDNVRMREGSSPSSPEASWSTLTIMNDERGGRQLVNGGFEDAIGDHAQDPDNSGPNSNPHVCGNSLPGWLVTQENVDVISTFSPEPEGDWVLDTGGHGPGGIAQTITGLTPGSNYTFSFWYARHSFWGSAEMTGEILANGVVVSTLTRTIEQAWNRDGFELYVVELTASAQGDLEIELRSTTKDQGGNIIYDDLRIKE